MSRDRVRYECTQCETEYSPFNNACPCCGGIGIMQKVEIIPTKEERQKRVKEIIEKFQEYVKTYDAQASYLDYTDETIIKDMIYGLGIALDDKYRWAKGFDKFKKVIEEHIK